MKVTINDCTIELRDGDVAAQEVDAIVNAANSHLAGGGGVDGAIHRAGGPLIMADTSLRYPEGCPTGSAVISIAGSLKARHVIHAVGPVWRGGQEGEAELLAAAYRRSLELAVQNSCRTVAMPALSTGAYGYPIELASRVAIATVGEFLSDVRAPDLVRFVLFGRAAFDVFAAALKELLDRT